jgi:hypothetical protein
MMMSLVRFGFSVGLVVFTYTAWSQEPAFEEFRPHLIDDASGVGLQIAATDVNGDGSLDVLTASKLGTFLFLARPRRSFQRT